MGYKPKRTIYKLDFSQTEYAGLEVAVRAGSIGDLLALQDLAGAGETTAEEARQMFAGFAALLVSWNVDDDNDKPVPTTYEGVASQEPDFIKTIVTAFFVNVAGAPPPLPDGSNSGANSEGAPIPGLAESSRSLRS